jgi:hypothetical protein
LLGCLSQDCDLWFKSFSLSSKVKGERNEKRGEREKKRERERERERER